MTRRPAPRRAPSRRGPSRAKGLSAGRWLAITGGSALLTLGAILALLALAGLWIYQGPGPKAPHGGHITVDLRPGAGLQEIAATLRREGVIGSAPLFLFAAQATHSARSLKAGEYDFPSHASMARVMDDIREGRVVHHMVTIPEGITAEQAVDILMKSDVLTGAAPVPAEGSILPETYEVRRGEDRSAVLQRMMEARDLLLRTLWSKRRIDLPYNSPEQAVILASVVEKETAAPSERPRIAAVFVNRLQKGMRLESDPTVIYGLTRGQPLGHGLRLSELTAPSAYNTYLNDGLPPTPIGNPGRASLAAALDPPRTTELYFVADGGGGHVFSSTYEQHQKNVDHWRKVEPKSPPAPGAKPSPKPAPKPVAAKPKPAAHHAKPSRHHAKPAPAKHARPAHKTS